MINKQESYNQFIKISQRKIKINQMISQKQRDDDQQLSTFQDFKELLKYKCIDLPKLNPSDIYFEQLIQWVNETMIKCDYSKEKNQVGSCKLTMYGFMAGYEAIFGQQLYKQRDPQIILPIGNQIKEHFLDKLEKSSIFGFRIKEKNQGKDHCVIFLKIIDHYIVMHSFQYQLKETGQLQYGFSFEEYLKFFKGSRQVDKRVLIGPCKQKKKIAQISWKDLDKTLKPWRDPMLYLSCYQKALKNEYGEQFPTSIKKGKFYLKSQNKNFMLVQPVQFVLLRKSIVKEYFHN